jgi:hypothetical protein
MDDLIESIASDLSARVNLCKGTTLVFLALSFIGGCSASSCSRSVELDNKTYFSKDVETRLSDLELKQEMVTESLKKFAGKTEKLPSSNIPESVQPKL